MPPGSPSQRVKWYRITAWRKLAETCAQYVKKGQRILVEGEVDASVWVDSQGWQRPCGPRTHSAAVRFLGPSGEATTGLSEREEQSEGRNKELPSGGEDTENSSLSRNRDLGTGVRGQRIRRIVDSHLLTPALRHTQTYTPC